MRKPKLLEASEKTLAEIAKSPLLSRVGEPITRRNVAQPPTWHAALKSVLSTDWYNFRLERQNESMSIVHIHFPKESMKWNPISDYIRPQIDAVITPAIQSLHERLGIRKIAYQEFFYSVRVDLMGVIEEIEYEKYYKHPLCRTLLPWYLEGHLPCGWEGEYPKGRLLVY